jgi:hypothetical protein
MNEDFYVGYDTPIPRGARRLVFGSVAIAVLLASAVAIVAAAFQAPIAPAAFAYGQRDTFTGVVRVDPYPTLETPTERLLLVAPGKHGADEMMRLFVGRRVTLEGALIVREGRRMIEVAPGFVREVTADGHAAPQEVVADLGAVTLSGEIVDGKCFLGVMRPGEGTVHRDCARACLRGGLPALFSVRTDDGQHRIVTLVADPHGSLAGAAALVGRPVSISGRLEIRQPGAELVLRTNVASIRPL